MSDTPKVCEHGSLARKCELCERDDEIKRLERELAQANAAHDVTRRLWAADKETLADMTANRNRYKVAHEQCLIERNSLDVRRAQAEAGRDIARASAQVIIQDRDRLQLERNVAQDNLKAVTAERDALAQRYQSALQTIEGMLASGVTPPA